jgi:hypothetical protein
MKQNAFRPRDLLNKEVAGICGVARLTDKARAAHAGKSEVINTVLLPSKIWGFYPSSVSQQKLFRKPLYKLTMMSNWVRGFWTTVEDQIKTSPRSIVS